jgi:probable pyridine nucleotide-disulfide oxidoreductase
VDKSLGFAMLGGLPFTALRDGIVAHPSLAEGLDIVFSSLWA